MDVILQIEGLSIGFHSERGYTPAVEGISFALERGETLGLVGESGSGKSLTALSLLRLTDHLPFCSVVAQGLRYFPGEEPVDIASLTG
ncbi:ATP-binding cassette domain-containing protein, partial [Arthrospira platensis SPKY1]|nr:ATP-binding cassette domain-containing protein [Arthrospira platensis SPKY1]